MDSGKGAERCKDGADEHLDQDGDVVKGFYENICDVAVSLDLDDFLVESAWSAWSAAIAMLEVDTVGFVHVDPNCNTKLGECVFVREGSSWRRGTRRRHCPICSRIGDRICCRRWASAQERCLLRGHCTCW